MNVFLAALAIVAVGLSAWTEAAAEDVKIPGYVVTVWGASEGAPQDVGNIAQTTDGTLWLGTNNGLFRFDGHRFTEYDVAPRPLPASRQVRDVVPDPKGGLWVLYGDAVEIHLAADGRTVSVPTGLPSSGIDGAFVHADGRTFVTANDQLYVLEGDRWKRCEAPEWTLPSGEMDTPSSDAEGGMLTAAGDAIYRLPRGSQHFVEVAKLAEPGFGGQLVGDPTGRLWVTYRKYTEVPGVRMPTRPAPVNTNHITLFDPHGTFWTVQQGCDGLCMAPFETAVADMREGRRPTRTSVIPAGNLTALTLMRDATGDIWVGARQGLIRLHKSVAQPITAFERGLGWFGVSPGADGTTLVTTYTRGGYNKIGRIDGQDVELIGGEKAISALTRLPDGSAVLVGDDAMYRVRGSAIETMSQRPGVGPTLATHPAQIVMPQAANRFWVSIRDEGLYLVDGANWGHVGIKEGYPSAYPMSGAQAADGTTWFGYADGSLAELAPGATSSPRMSRVSSIGALTAISPGEPFFIGGETGAGIVANGTFSPLQLRRPGLLRGVTGIVRTPDGDAWFNTARGLIRVAAGDLATLRDDPTRVLPYDILTTADGLPGGAQQVRPLPTLNLASDGLLWVAGVSGLATVDPRHVPTASAAAPVLLDMRDGKGASILAGGVLQPGSRAIDAELAGVSLSDPGFVDLRYRLVGVDPDWRHATDEARISYADLPPGRFRLEVQARGPTRDWSPSVLSAPVDSMPAFFETRWFAALMVVLVVAAAFAGHLFRMAVVRRRQEATANARLRERDRIARELHDSMLQGMAGVMLRVIAWERDKRAPDELRSGFRIVADQLSSLIMEARARVIALRSVASYRMPLSEALAMVGEDYGSASAASFHLRVEGQETPLDDVAHLAVMDIVREALNNAFSHAQATAIEVTLRYGDADLVVEVKDNGVGLPELVTAEGRRPGHWGMVTMRERATEMGGSVSIDTDGNGTTVTLVVPKPRT